MEVLTNTFDTHLSEALHSPCNKLFMYVSGRIDGDDTHLFWRSYCSFYSSHTTYLTQSLMNSIFLTSWGLCFQNVLIFARLSRKLTVQNHTAQEQSVLSGTCVLESLTSTIHRTSGPHVNAGVGQDHTLLTIQPIHMQLLGCVSVWIFFNLKLPLFHFRCFCEALMFISSKSRLPQFIKPHRDKCQTSFSVAAQWKLITYQSIHLQSCSQM